MFPDPVQDGSIDGAVNPPSAPTVLRPNGIGWTDILNPGFDAVPDAVEASVMASWAVPLTGWSVFLSFFWNGLAGGTFYTAAITRSFNGTRLITTLYRQVSGSNATQLKRVRRNVNTSLDVFYLCGYKYCEGTHTILFEGEVELEYQEIVASRQRYFGLGTEKFNGGGILLDNFCIQSATCSPSPSQSPSPSPSPTPSESQTGSPTPSSTPSDGDSPSAGGGDSPSQGGGESPSGDGDQSASLSIAPVSPSPAISPSPAASPSQSQDDGGGDASPSQSASSSISPTQSVCGCESIPDNLTIEFTNVLDCSHLDGLTLTLTWNPNETHQDTSIPTPPDESGGWLWEGPLQNDPPLGLLERIFLFCINSTDGWALEISCDGMTTNLFESVKEDSCDPFSLFNASNTGHSCCPDNTDGDFEISITE